MQFLKPTSCREPHITAHPPPTSGTTEPKLIHKQPQEEDQRCEKMTPWITQQPEEKLSSFFSRCSSYKKVRVPKRQTTQFKTMGKGPE